MDGQVFRYQNESETNKSEKLSEAFTYIKPLYRIRMYLNKKTHVYPYIHVDKHGSDPGNRCTQCTIVHVNMYSVVLSITGSFSKHGKVHETNKKLSTPTS